MGNNSENDFVAIRSEYTMVSRILTSRQDDDDEHLVKWVGLNYNECYWELKSDISSFQQQIENFNTLHSKHRKLRRQKSNIRDTADPKKKLKEVQQFEKSPDFLPGGELHPYQLEGLYFLRFSWSKQTHVILADKMGLASLYEENVSPHLVVTPLSTLRNWDREFAMWAPHMNVVRMLVRLLLS
ncbi:CHD3-type chromatin-remodeling factor PICKLE-like [Rutidosis leptorrhynchoides]|uniref:CHD3-type chromatin-remodeling factor PICKLE-like n=1 Tax=Rutidosis leptorrhynchoides TaxID=125765 RepID=UPI003A992CBD